MTEEIKIYMDKYSNWTNDKLQDELQKEEAETFKHLSKVIAIIKTLDARGIDLKLPKHKVKLYRKLAYGKIAIQAYSKFIGTLAGRYVFRLPVKQQISLASDTKLKVYNPDKVEALPVQALRPKQLQQVFYDHSIRTVEEQKTYYYKLKENEKSDNCVYLDTEKREMVVIIKSRVRRINFEQLRELFNKSGYNLTIKPNE